MEFKYFINMTVLFGFNICFLLSGISLNSLVIISFWRSAKLRKKLCYFMIMVLSCCDLLAVLTNHSLMVYTVMLWLTGNGSLTRVIWVRILSRLSSAFLGLSLLALLVMNFDRYLATYHPIFHRTSATKGKLLTLFAILVGLVLLLFLSTIFLSYQVVLLIFLIIFAPPLLFINYKLYTMAKKGRKNRRISPDTRKTFSFKHISSCLLAVACFLALSIPTYAYVGLRMHSDEKKSTLDIAELFGMWATSIGSMNGTFNCLLFYWKNAILRIEGMKVIKGMKIFNR